MKALIVASALILAASTAQAKMPFVNATCPTGIDLHADEGGPAYINGKEAKINKHNNKAYTVRHGHTKIDVTINPDESLSVTYTGEGGANGICKVTSDDSSLKHHKKNKGECPPDVSEADRANYPACN